MSVDFISPSSLSFVESFMVNVTSNRTDGFLLPSRDGHSIRDISAIHDQI